MTGEKGKETKGTTVLVVDDEPFIREIVGMMLENLGFAVLTATGGNEAVQLVEKHREKLFLVFCDLTMPGMDGWQTISSIRAIAPELPVVLTSGYAIDWKTCSEHADQPWAVMNKPYVYNDLKILLRKVREQRFCGLPGSL